MGLADDIAAVLERLDLFGSLRPANHDAERDRFFAALDDGERYDPQYAYAVDVDLDAVADTVADIAERLESPLADRFVAGLIGRGELIAAIGTDRITDRSEAVYGRPDAETVAAARERFEVPRPDRGGDVVDAAQLRDAFQDLFSRLGMDYGCELVADGGARNVPAQQAVLVPQDGTYGAVQARRLLVHESTHAVRTFNGLASSDPVLAYGTAGYEIVEEGLTALNEEAVGVFADTVPRITARVIAVDAAENGFHDLYDTMQELGLDRATAFTRTFRVKRGLQDTAGPGGFIKDHIYFQGYRLLQAHQDRVDALYAGKVGLDDLELVETEPTVGREAHLDAYREAAEALPGAEQG